MKVPTEMLKFVTRKQSYISSKECNHENGYWETYSKGNYIVLIKLILILDMYLPNKDKHKNIGRHRFIIKLKNSYFERAILQLIYCTVQ